MTSKNKVLFNLNVNTPNKIKLMALHPKKQWIAIITTNNTFSLWNYRQRILIKSFNCNTLEDSKNFDIRQMVFYDRFSLPYNTNVPVRTNIIFVSPFRIYLYDYLTDAIKQINEKEIQQKNIKKVCVYSESKICVSLNDGSFKILDSKDLYTKNTMTIKNIRGYHTKPITWLIAYCQNANQMPRVITVSSQDGLMACWNVDTLLHSQHVPDPASPSFKFVMQKGGKNDSNNGEEILSLQYDNSSYRLVTLTQSYITIWSTMTGMELRRLKNSKYRQITFFNHFSFGGSCFLVHSNKSQLALLRVNVNECELQQIVDVKNFIREADSTIVSVKTLPQNPSEVFICTQSFLCVIEVNKFYRPSYGFHQNFVTRLTTLNSKEFIIRSEGLIKPDITPASIAKMTFEEDILFNSFYFSFQAGWIIFNLIEIQYENMLFEQRKYKMKRVAENSPLFKPTNSQALIEVRFDGKEFFVFNKDLSYYQIYGTYNSSSQLLSLNEQNTTPLDFYSKLVLIDSGYSRDIVWHQYKQQFAVVKGFDKNGNVVQLVSEKKGILGRGEYVSKLSAEVVNWCVCVFERESVSNKYCCIFKSEPMNTKIFRVYNFGFLFGYSNDQVGSETIVFINDQKSSSKEIEGVPFWPQRIFISYCESYQIFVYEGYFVIYKIQENGQLSYFRSVQQTIHQGLFWEKFFFFSTKTSMYFMQINHQDILLIKIADTMCSNEPKQTFFNYDDLQDYQQILPEGQLQMLTVINMHLFMLNHTGQIFLLNLKNYPYIEFCIEVVLGNVERLHTIYRNSSIQIQKSMKETLNSYGIILQQLH